MTVLDAADLVVIAARTLGIGSDDALAAMDVNASRGFCRIQDSASPFSVRLYAISPACATFRASVASRLGC